MNNRGGAVCKKTRFLYCIYFFTKSVLQKLSHAIFQHSTKYCKIHKMLNSNGNLWRNAVISVTKTTLIGFRMKIPSKNSFFVVKWAKMIEKLHKKSIFLSIYIGPNMSKLIFHGIWTDLFQFCSTRLKKSYCILQYFLQYTVLHKYHTTPAFVSSKSRF